MKLKNPKDFLVAIIEAEILIGIISGMALWRNIDFDFLEILVAPIFFAFVMILIDKIFKKDTFIESIVGISGFLSLFLVFRETKGFLVTIIIGFIGMVFFTIITDFINKSIFQYPNPK